MAETLTFALVPDLGKRVRFDALEAAIEELRRLIRDVDMAVFRSEGVARRRQWFVHRLSSSNPTITLEADQGTSPLERRTDETLFDGVRGIVEGETDAPPPFFSEQELQGLISIRRRVLTKGLQRIDLGTGTRTGTIAIASTIEERVNRILRGTIEVLGSLDGELDAINTRTNPYFTMWELMSSQPIRCNFAADRIEEVKAVLHRRVRVSGLVRYFSDGRPRAISHVEMIKDLTSPKTLGKDYWGCLPNLASSGDTVELLHRGFG
jgi:hypothetical protein